MSCPNNANMSGRQRQFAPRHFKRIQRNFDRAHHMAAGHGRFGLFLQLAAQNDYDTAKVLVRKHGGVGLERMV